MTPFTTLMLLLCAANVTAGLASVFLWDHQLTGCALVANSLVCVWLAWWTWDKGDPWDE